MGRWEGRRTSEPASGAARTTGGLHRQAIKATATQPFTLTSNTILAIGARARALVYHQGRVNDLVDIGANLTNKAFRNDLDAVLARARAAGVSTIVLTGTDAAGSQAAVALAQRHALFATAGIHPHHAKDATPAELEAIASLLRRPQVVAVGECGLDYHRMFSPKEAQLRCFERHLTLAKQSGKPLFLHERDASADFIALLKDHRRDLGAAVVHCFTGDAATLDAYLALDLHIGITAWICDERRGHHLRDLVARVPRDRIGSGEPDPRHPSTVSAPRRPRGRCTGVWRLQVLEEIGVG